MVIINSAIIGLILSLANTIIIEYIEYNQRKSIIIRFYKDISANALSLEKNV